ncbi:RT0821/Lpp0805 family surface protein [Allorhizobium terrae]|nr:RT0821/Lpp0805 family surface protein [Allorhizobium terrae]TWD55219.1 outer membrane surface antigen [Agrobacterium vitis]
MEDIAKPDRYRKRRTPAGVHFSVVAALCLMMSGCVASTLDFSDTAKVDRSISTGSIPLEPEKVADQDTIRNAVSSADLGRLGNNPVPWANASTGSAGVITTIAEDVSSGVVCRAFVTSRHAYDGIAKFYGRTCLVGNGQWQLVNFSQQS